MAKKKARSLRKDGIQGRPYPKAFVRDAIRLAKKLGSASAAAAQLGVHRNTVRKWVRIAASRKGAK